MDAKKKARVFVQTAAAPLSELDRWVQVGEEEARAVYEMTLKNELSGGTEQVRAFENEFREFTGLKHAISVINGTAAIWSAMYGCYVGPGDEVICPVYTWLCSITPAPMLGARPVFCDVSPHTLLMDPEDVKKKITSRTRAIVAVHLWGMVCDMQALGAISQETGIPIIEDCSHAHGALYGGRVVGAIGKVGTWSMQGSKAVSAGEGGVLATDDDEVFDRACMIGQVNRAAGLDLVSAKYQKYQPLGLGIKFRAHPLGIGIARVQLRKLGLLNAGRGGYIEAVERALKEIPGLDPVTLTDGTKRGGYYGFPTIFRAEQVPGVTRDQYVNALRAHGVPASSSPYDLLHRLPYFAEGMDVFGFGRGVMCEGYNGYKEGDFPGAEEMHRNVVFLPVLTDPVEGATEEIIRRIRKGVESLGF